MQPVVNVLSTEINTNKDLMTHSLLSTGISDSVLIRLLFRPTNRTLEEVQHENEVVLQALNEQEAARKAKEEEERKRKAEEEEKKKILASSDSASLPTESTAAQVNMGTEKEKEKEKKKEKEVEVAETRTEMEMETRDVVKEEKEKRTKAKGKAKMNTEEHAQQRQQQETTTPEPTTMGEEMDVEVLQAFQQGADIRQKEREVADLIRKKKELEQKREEEAWKKNIPERNTKVFAPSDRPFSLKDFEVPDHFFEVLPSDFAASDRARRQKEETAGMLKTREQREKERLQHVNKFSKTLVRIRFPNRLELQATFHPNESTTAVMEFVQEQLAHPDLPFYLFTTPPRQKVDLKQSLKAQLFVPAAVLHFAWDSPTGPEDYLKPELMANICENLSSYSSSSSSSSSSASSSSSTSSTGRSTTSRTASSSSSSGEGSSSSKPKNTEQQTQKLRSWLKLGKK
ncbi:Tether containing UBX domain for GLUT4, variant 2 [Balamuthia mandrillaris]